MTTKHLRIKGRVQGVFYRATAKEVAEGLGLTGWIRNTADGDVETIVSGDDEAIKKFIDWCWKGPGGALVTNVEVYEMPEEAFGNFTILRG